MKADQLAKSLLKIGARALAPFGGDVFLTALQEFGTITIDEATAARSKKVAETLLKKLEAGITQFAKAEGLSPTHADTVFHQVETLLLRHPMQHADWVGGGFDAERSTANYLRRVDDALQSLDREERSLAERFVRDFNGQMLQERVTIDALEIEFRAAVLDTLDKLPERIGATVAGSREALATVAAAALVGLPVRRWREGISPPGALLRADIDVPVPFHGRDAELRDLVDWSARPSRLGLRLFTGAGGMGKSRLLIETCRRLADDGWRAGFLSSRALGTDRSVFDLLVEQPRLFVVLDYAETRREEAKQLLAAAFASSGGGTRTRIVFLARSAEDWWDALRAEGNGVGDIVGGPATERIALRPLAVGLDERQHSFALARAHFAAHLGAVPALEEPGDLGDACYKAVLLLQMRALAVVEGVAVKGEQGILTYMLDRERRYWTDRARASGVEDVLLRGVDQAMASVTLGGGVATPADAIVLLRRIQLLADQPQAVLSAVSEVLHQVYPGERWIEPVQPDLLGEHLVETELAEAENSLFDIVFDDPPR